MYQFAPHLVLTAVIYIHLLFFNKIKRIYKYIHTVVNKKINICVIFTFLQLHVTPNVCM